jgi:hypothetical protein
LDGLRGLFASVKVTNGRHIPSAQGIIAMTLNKQDIVHVVNMILMPNMSSKQSEETTT